MARKKNKGSPAQNADHPSVPQSQKPRALPSQAQGPHPKSAAAKTSIKKTEQRPEAKPKATGIPAPNRSSSAPKTGVKLNKPGKTAAKPDKPLKDTGGQAPPSQTKRQTNMANRNNNQNRAAPARNVQTAQLELPEGYTPPAQPAKKKQRRRPNRTTQNPDTQQPVTLPWVVNPEYPKPLGIEGTYHFNYNRSAWISLFGSDVEAEMKKQIVRYIGLQFRRPGSQLEGQLKELHRQYWKAGELELLKVKKALTRTGKPVSGRLFLASSAVDVEEDQHDSADAENDQRDLVDAENKERKPDFFDVLVVAELGGMIIELLIPSIGDLTALAMTSKLARACVRCHFDVWDFRLNIDEKDEKFPTDPYFKRRDENDRLVQEGGVRVNTLIISPVLDEPEGVQKPFMADFQRTMKLCQAITEIPATFRSLILDQVPFFDAKMFHLMIKTMPTLETVTITRCIMLDVTKLPQLLATIRRNPRVMKTRRTRPMFDDAWAKKLARAMCKTAELEARAQGVAARRAPVPTTATPTNKTTKKDDEDYVCLDFFPFFFHGPSSGLRLGSYGVTHNEPTFNAPKAVFALILQCWDLAQEVGMDLVSDSSSFWRFVRQLPGPDALWAMKAREALLTREYEKVMLPARHQQMVQVRFADDLTAALTGDNQQHPVAPGGMRKYLPHDYEGTGKYWRLKAKCVTCKVTYPVSLFPLWRDSCWGCKMTTFIHEMEDSHARLWQERALQMLRHGLDLRSADLQRFMRHVMKQTLEKAACDVQLADWVREHFLSLPTTTHLSTDDWVTGVSVEEAHCPPPPRGLDSTRAALVRWRWNKAPATEAFDWRQGGPQWAHPCKNPLSPADYWPSDDNAGGETKKQFKRNWEWTRESDEIFITRYLEVHEMKRRERRQKRPFHTPLAEINDRDDERVLKALKDARGTPEWVKYVMNEERRAQDKSDKGVHRLHYGIVQDLTFSIGTLNRKPFNLDTPVPDPVVNKKAYDVLKTEAAMLPRYNHERV